MTILRSFILFTVVSLVLIGASVALSFTNAPGWLVVLVGLLAFAASVAWLVFLIRFIRSRGRHSAR
jgi:hypothetical protein